MKKISLFLLLLLGMSPVAFGQIKWDKYSQTYPEKGLDKTSTVCIVVMEKMENNTFWSVSPSILLQNRLENDSAFASTRPKDFVAINTYDTCAAHFVLHGVTAQNAGSYEYRVMQDTTRILASWQPITRFLDSAASKGLTWGKIAYLGGYTTGLQHQIVVDVREKVTGKIIQSAVVYWQPVKPAIVQVYTADELNDFLSRLKHSWTLKNDGPVKQKSIFKPTENNLIFYLNAEITDKNLLEYELIKDNKVQRKWAPNDFDQGFIWLRNLPPGKYNLKFRYKVQRQHVSSYPFQIKTAWYQSTTFKIIGGSLIATFFAFIILLIVLVRQKQQAITELSKKTKLQLELQAIHSQLNPHFVFNAMASIQGLINKNDITGANNYLSDFALLLRNSLANADKEQTPLSEEIKTLETYLKLEQLRFKFAFQINIAQSINVYETEIPSLLLQPLLENAIKHGIAILKEEGQITLDINRVNQNMAVTLADNGDGFDINHNASGLGLKLTRDRVKLLNQMMPGQEIIFDIKTSPKQGTIITLTFNNWFNEN